MGTSIGKVFEKLRLGCLRGPFIARHLNNQPKNNMTNSIVSEIEELKKKILAIDPECDVSRPTFRRTAQLVGIQVEENLTVGELIKRLSELNKNNFVKVQEADWDQCALIYSEEEVEVEDFVYKNVLEQRLFYVQPEKELEFNLKSGKVLRLTIEDIEEISRRR